MIDGRAERAVSGHDMLLVELPTGYERIAHENERIANGLVSATRAEQILGMSV